MDLFEKAPIVIGGIGSDNDLTCFGDTIHTIDKFSSYIIKHPNTTFYISTNVQLNAMQKRFNESNSFSKIEEIIKNCFGKKISFNHIKDLISLTEWDIIKKSYPNIQIDTSKLDFGNNYTNGYIALVNDVGYIAVAKSLVVIFDGQIDIL